MDQITLSPEQGQILAQNGTRPVRALDPATNAAYVLIPEELYARVTALLDDGLDMQQTAALVERSMEEYDADDPLLETYQRYRP